jgi:hypothetical protein
MPMSASTTFSFGASAARVYERADRVPMVADVFRKARRLTVAMTFSQKDVEDGAKQDGNRILSGHRT